MTSKRVRSAKSRCAVASTEAAASDMSEPTVRTSFGACPPRDPISSRTPLVRKAAGLAVAVRAGQEEVRFEWAEQSHHHLICDQCGHVSEVSLDAAPALERQVSRAFGFETRVRHLALRGTCRSCTGTREK